VIVSSPTETLLPLQAGQVLLTTRPFPPHFEQLKKLVLKKKKKIKLN